MQNLPEVPMKGAEPSKIGTVQLRLTVCADDGGPACRSFLVLSEVDDGFLLSQQRGADMELEFGAVGCVDLDDGQAAAAAGDGLDGPGLEGDALGKDHHDLQFGQALHTRTVVLAPRLEQFLN